MGFVTPNMEGLLARCEGPRDASLVCVGCYRVAVRFWVLLAMSEYVPEWGMVGWVTHRLLDAIGHSLDCDGHRACVGRDA